MKKKNIYFEKVKEITFKLMDLKVIFLIWDISQREVSHFL